MIITAARQWLMKALPGFKCKNQQIYQLVSRKKTNSQLIISKFLQQKQLISTGYLDTNKYILWAIPGILPLVQQGSVLHDRHALFQLNMKYENDKVKEFLNKTLNCFNYNRMIGLYSHIHIT